MQNNAHEVFSGANGHNCIALPDAWCTDDVPRNKMRKKLSKLHYLVFSSMLILLKKLHAKMNPPVLGRLLSTDVVVVRRSIVIFWQWASLISKVFANRHL